MPRGSRNRPVAGTDSAVNLRIGSPNVIYARIDVDLIDHPRIVGAKDPDAALGLWTWGLLYTRRHELDGRIPKAALGASKLRAARALALVEAGLWEDHGDHFVMTKYEAKGNQTKAQIEEAKKLARDRQARFRGKTTIRNGDVTRDRSVSNAVTNAFVTSSSSNSQTVSPESERGEPRGEATAEPVTREQEYQRAYETGIARGKGSPFAMPEPQRGALHQGMLAHGIVGGKRVKGPELLAWIERQAFQFAAWLVKQDAKTIGYYSSYGPRGWLAWMNATPVRKAITEAKAESGIARAGPTLPANESLPLLAGASHPANENAAPFNVGALVAKVAGGWKP